MRSLQKTLSILFLIMVCAATTTIRAQADSCLTGGSYSAWFNCRVKLMTAANIEQRGVNKQVQTPSIGDATTSLVDQTDAPDLVGLALNFAGLNSGSTDENKSVNSITTSAYAFYAAVKQKDPLDPDFYKENSDLRKFSFTFGREAADESNNNQAATILGFKYLLINNRDVSRAENIAIIDDLVKELKDSTRLLAATEDEVRNYIREQLSKQLGIPDNPTIEQRQAFIDNHLNAANLAATLALLSKEQQAEINRIINKRIQAEVDLTDANQKTIEKIRRKQQLSFTFQSKSRSGMGADEYRAGLIYDFGKFNKLNFALNGTFDYKDAKIIGGDTRGGRFAAEAYYRLTNDKKLISGKDPLMLSFAGEGKWMSGKGPTYQGQAKLTIPLFDGISIPFSVTYANRKDLIKESTIRGNFGFTFDLAKALKGFRK